jgi:hypothetical protein
MPTIFPRGTVSEISRRASTTGPFRDHPRRASMRQTRCSRCTENVLPTLHAAQSESRRRCFHRRKFSSAVATRGSPAKQLAVDLIEAPASSRRRSAISAQTPARRPISKRFSGWAIRSRKTGSTVCGVALMTGSSSAYSGISSRTLSSHSGRIKQMTGFAEHHRFADIGAKPAVASACPEKYRPAPAGNGLPCWECRSARSVRAPCPRRAGARSGEDRRGRT